LDGAIVDNSYGESEGRIELAGSIGEVHRRWFGWTVRWYVWQDTFDVDPEDIPFIEEVISRGFL
jgi:hypothetical protein